MTSSRHLIDYFVISNSDGDTLVTKVSAEELTKRLEEKYYGDVGFVSNLDERNTNYWRDNILIIKGEIVVPKPKSIIQSYEI